MQMNHMYELQKQMNAAPMASNQFAMHAQLLGANPQHQAILNQQHILSQQLSQQQPPLSPILAPLKRGRKANDEGDSRKRRKKDPNRPKRAMTPYFFFTAEYRNSLRREGKAVPGVKEVAQYCGPKWNAMSEDEKRPFIESAEMDRKRYLGEMNIYKKPRDEDKPKRPASAYFHFLVEFRKKMAGKPLPEHTTIPKLSGALWQKMTEEERRPYNEKMEEEKKVYEQKLAEYRKMKAEEAIKTAQKKDGGEKESPGYQQPEYNSFNSTSNGSTSSPQNSGVNMSQISQYSDLNRHIQMMSDNKSWQTQLQNMQAVQAVHHYNNYPYSDMYNSPGSSHSGMQMGVGADDDRQQHNSEGSNALQIHPDLQEQLKQHEREQQVAQLLSAHLAGGGPPQLNQSREVDSKELNSMLQDQGDLEDRDVQRHQNGQASS